MFSVSYYWNMNKAAEDITAGSEELEWRIIFTWFSKLSSNKNEDEINLKMYRNELKRKQVRFSKWFYNIRVPF